MGGAPFVAAVLTGGASRRMGRDKATLPLDGEPMALRVAHAARSAGAAEVITIGRAIEGVGEHRDDDHPGQGPLGGLLTALRWAGTRSVVVLGCDLLTPSPPAVAEVVERLDSDPLAAAAVPVVGGRDQWLHAGWRPGEALASLEAAFAGGERSLHRGVAGLRILRYDAADPAAFADADAATDLPPGSR